MNNVTAGKEWVLTRALYEHMGNRLIPLGIEQRVHP